MKIRLVGAELFHVGGRTDRHDEAKSRFYTGFPRFFRVLSRCNKKHRHFETALTLTTLLLED
jgi:hypothetical protein